MKEMKRKCGQDVCFIFYSLAWCSWPTMGGAYIPCIISNSWRQWMNLSVMRCFSCNNFALLCWRDFVGIPRFLISWLWVIQKSELRQHSSLSSVQSQRKALGEFSGHLLFTLKKSDQKTFIVLFILFQVPASWKWLVLNLLV